MIEFMLSQGSQSKMYTLWQIVTTPNGGYSQRYIKNLSTDHETAFKLAEDWANRAGAALIDYSMDTLRPIHRVHKWTDDMVRFGKNKGKKIADCDEKFILWISKGSPLYDEEYQCWCNHYFGGEAFMAIAQSIAIEKGLAVMYKDRFMSNEQYAKALEREKELASQNIGHHFEDGQRVSLVACIQRKNGYDTAYGYVTVYTLKDEENRIFTYKGTAHLGCVGEKVKITTTIQHGSYKEQPTTYLKRPKVVEVLVDEACEAE